MNFVIQIHGIKISIIDTKTLKDVKEEIFDIVFDGEYEQPVWTYEFAAKLLELYDAVPEEQINFCEKA